MAATHSESSMERRGRSCTALYSLVGCRNDSFASFAAGLKVRCNWNIETNLANIEIELL